MVPGIAPADQMCEGPVDRHRLEVDAVDSELSGERLMQLFVSDVVQAQQGASEWERERALPAEGMIQLPAVDGSLLTEDLADAPRRMMTGRHACGCSKTDPLVAGWHGPPFAPGRRTGRTISHLCTLSFAQVLHDGRSSAEPLSTPPQLPKIEMSRWTAASTRD